MQNFFRKMALAGGLTFAAALTACGGGAVGVGYNVYDPYYGDYHYWGPDEVVYYNRWLNETHRHQRDFRRLPAAQQHEYWTWRHAQPAAPPAAARPAPPERR